MYVGHDKEVKNTIIPLLFVRVYKLLIQREPL